MSLDFITVSDALESFVREQRVRVPDEHIVALALITDGDGSSLSAARCTAAWAATADETSVHDPGRWPLDSPASESFHLLSVDMREMVEDLEGDDLARHQVRTVEIMANALVMVRKLGLVDPDTVLHPMVLGGDAFALDLYRYWFLKINAELPLDGWKRTTRARAERLVDDGAALGGQGASHGDALAPGACEVTFERLDRDGFVVAVKGRRYAIGWTSEDLGELATMAEYLADDEGGDAAMRLGRSFGDAEVWLRARDGELSFRIKRTVGSRASESIEIDLRPDEAAALEAALAEVLDDARHGVD